jgi:hypothetical protein
MGAWLDVAVDKSPYRKLRDDGANKRRKLTISAVYDSYRGGGQLILCWSMHMKRIVERVFTVRAPLALVWGHLAAVEKWPSWAKHIRRLRSTQKDDCAPRATGVFACQTE